MASAIQQSQSSHVSSAILFYSSVNMRTPLRTNETVQDYIRIPSHTGVDNDEERDETAVKLWRSISNISGIFWQY